MKKVVIITILVCLWLSFFITDCMAVKIKDPDPKILNVYLVGALGSTEQQLSFDESETPYLYMELQQGISKDTTINTTWFGPDGAEYFSTTGVATGTDRWIGLEDWDAIRKEGLWNVSAQYITQNGKSGTGFASFTVTPEPYGIILFLVGSLVIGIKLNKQYGYFKLAFLKNLKTSAY